MFMFGCEDAWPIFDKRKNAIIPYLLGRRRLLANMTRIMYKNIGC